MMKVYFQVHKICKTCLLCIIYRMSNAILGLHAETTVELQHMKQMIVCKH